VKKATREKLREAIGMVDECQRQVSELKVTLRNIEAALDQADEALMTVWEETRR